MNITLMAIMLAYGIIERRRSNKFPALIYAVVAISYVFVPYFDEPLLFYSTAATFWMIMATLLARFGTNSLAFRLMMLSAIGVAINAIGYMCERYSTGLLGWYSIDIYNVATHLLYITAVIFAAMAGRDGGRRRDSAGTDNFRGDNTSHRVHNHVNSERKA